jgi:OOP family OmpA-OmpF porin
MWDLLDAHHFRNKAMASLAGRTPAPEILDDRTLPYGHLPELTAARVRLVGALEAGAGRFVPEPAARAQARFDCWVEQQEEDFQPDDIQRCRDGFYAALVTVERALAAAEPAAYTLFFDFDSAGVTADHAATLDAIAEAAKAGRAARLMVSGHADRAGPEPYNLVLSRRRAEAIERALAGRGLDRARMTVVAHGEKRPRVATPDGAREALNRRVEIVVGAGPAM